MSKETVKKILVIDNDEYSLLLISDFLTFNNFQAIAATDGRLGLQLAREQKPDLIICDIDMPAANGYEV
ncbi:MAG TPA: response regulator, partial [Cyanobacteria bacterium UBA11049]|nr:response regulator [Cyanobacteria bacterium UBA11049]